ncbi:MAG TPA: glycosyltransferase [Bacteroidia bacterium]|nr:glycosyltransferase [Bacteroidia bacterium]
MKAKVCHVTTVHRPNDNRIFFKECKSLAEAGYDVTLLCANANSTVRDGIKIIGFKGYTQRIKRFFLTSIIQVFTEARKVNAEIYHLHDPELVWMGLLLRLTGKKVIMDVHENNAAAILSRPYMTNNFSKKLLSSIIKLVERITLPFFSGIITARPDISELFPKLNPVTLRNFPILPFYNDIPDLNIEKTKKAVIYVGGTSEIRGTLQLIEAFRYTKNAELWILGPFESDDFKRKCESLEGWSNVKYLGTVEADKIFSYIKAADLGIITFLPKPNHLTTLATKPFEYMACGLPMIMSDFDYWKSFFGEASLYVDPSDSIAIAKMVDLLAGDEEKLSHMKANNIKLATNEYNWQMEREKLFDLYRSVSGD